MSQTTAAEPTPQKVLDVQRWLRYAPEPPERGDRKYDAFISYRSSDREWAMALYDGLRLAGWEPFLDQFELVPGADLQTSLEDALMASASGVVLWSSRTADSEWCKRERRAMMTLKDEGGFEYLFAKLDHEKLPLFARADLYVDFEECPEGPRGVNLLRLMCGMRGVDLDDEAVRLAQQVDADAQRVMIAIKGAFSAGNAARLHQIGLSDDPGVLASAAPVVAAAEGLISMKKYDQALEVLERADKHFPKSIRARQLRGLALRRMGKFQEAIDVLSELEAAGHQDPETLGMLAAAWDGLSQGPTGKLVHLRKSRELYRTAFQANPSSYYTGINAASKSLFLGEADEAARLAALVLPLVKDAGDGRDYWAGCTLGEVLLLQRELDAAAAQYLKMIDTHPTRVGDLCGTRDQAARICKSLGLSEADTRKVMDPFALIEV
jgi:tetratricopeptide (TPR) repeat protein